MRGVGELSRKWRKLIAPFILGAFGSGCVSFSDGPARLYTVPEEAQLIRDTAPPIDLIRFSSLDEASRVRIRNDWIGARMYAIDIQYTPYEAALTKERQGVGFGAAATTIALTTASGLVAPVATKNVLTGLAGFVTGARAAYDSDILLSHSVQWIQSQMEAKRAEVSARILRGMKFSTAAYPLAAALSDLEAYYRAGTFTGGLLSTSEIVAADARNAALDKADEQGLLPGTVPLTPDQPLRLPPRRELPPGNPNFALILDPYNPKTQSPDFVKSIQTALCVPEDEIGVIGANTKGLIRIFEASRPLPAKRNGRLDAEEIDHLRGRGRCADTGPRNFFEKQTFRSNPTGQKALADLITKLNNVPGTQLQPGTSLDGARTKIREARGVLSSSVPLMKLPADLADQVTPDLIEALPK
jgi:hypothetical protein